MNEEKDLNKVEEQVTETTTPEVATPEVKEETPELPATKEEPKKEEEKKEEKPVVGIGEEVPMSEEEKAAKAAAQAQNFNSQEEVLYKMKADKGANPIGVLIFIGLLVAFALCLPKIVEKYGSIFEQKHNYFSSSNLKVPGGENPDEPEKPKPASELHSFAKSETVVADNLSFLNFVKANNEGTYELTFSIMNDGDEIYDYSKKYFMEFYDGEVKIGEKLIYSYDSIAPKSAAQVTIILNQEEFSNGRNYKILHKSQDSYPEANPTVDDGDYKIYKCVNGNNEITYYFTENLLEKIADDTKIPSTTKNYDTLLQSAREKSEAYRNVEGIDSNVIETSQSGFNIKTDIDLKTATVKDLSDLKQYKYFMYHEKASVVKYEITTLGYTCS